MNYDIFVECDN